MPATRHQRSFHDLSLGYEKDAFSLFRPDVKFTYTFENFFHPFVGELIAKLNRESLPGMLDAGWHARLEKTFFDALYQPTASKTVDVVSFPKQIDVSPHGPYSNYNWELLFHIPLTIATHLSKSQRFAEAQRWFHFLFDPTSNDTSVDPPARYWKFLAFRQGGVPHKMEELLALLSRPASELSPADQKLQAAVLDGYTAILNKPFQPHAVARTRQVAYQYCVVMKYLDNLIAWGDHLFQQDTLESINEATQRYVLAANLLGPRPQRIPPRGTVQPKTFAQLKAAGLDPMGNALVDLEAQFPFNFAPPPAAAPAGDASGSSLFGIGRTLYFCIPRNQKLLGYWDMVADRLFKIRHCMNLEGVVRPLALFDPPIDPGMLVKAAAAGLDLSSVISGLNQPSGPLRAPFVLQQALALCSEVRSLGGALLAALEKKDAEHLAMVRQTHEIQLQQMAQEVRYLQWRHAQENTTSLLTTRASALERLKYYERLLNLPQDQQAPDQLALDRSEKADDPPTLTEESFDQAYAALVTQYGQALTFLNLPKLTLMGDNSPAQEAGDQSPGRMYLNTHEDAELNQLAADAQAARDLAAGSEMTASGLAAIPAFNVEMHFWGLGASSQIAAGTMLSNAAKAVAAHFANHAQSKDKEGQNAWRSSTYERRGDEWILQHNLAAHELMQIGRQILTSLIAEQITHHEYWTVRQQISNAQEIQQFLSEKFTHEELYAWMRGEISRLYYEYYRFAFDTARKAERLVKQELMRAELDAQEFVKFNYWDSGHKGLLSGEALFLDLKRLEAAYHDANKRELELTRHVSLRQLHPGALLELRSSGTCQFTVPEWLFDMDCPGHYLRRIKSVALSIPCVTGPFASVNCTVSLLKSSLRKSSIAGDDYARQGVEDERFIDLPGGMQSIVTSGALNDSGLFETTLRDERFLPFEGAGAVSTWKLDLPKEFPAFDYTTISDVILHLRYTARQGVEPGKATAAVKALLEEAGQSDLALLFSLRHDFATEWAAFVGGADPLVAPIRREHFPYFTRGKAISIDGFELYRADAGGTLKHHRSGDQAAWEGAAAELNNPAQQAFVFRAAADAPGPNAVLTRAPQQEVFLLVRYSLS